MKKSLMLFSLMLLSPFLMLAQPAEPYEAEWHRIDSLYSGGMPESAQKLANEVYQKAKAKNQPVQMLKAQLYLVVTGMQRDEDAYPNAITKAEAEISNTSFPNNAMWQSITAQLYWQYYEQNRWKIHGRTAVAGTVTDFEQWDAARFYDKVSALYRASLARSAELKGINITVYNPVLTKGTNSENLRPTLFDLLAFRALSFFENDEKDVTNPAFAFVMDDAAAFADANEFMTHKFLSKDSLSQQWQALELYQQILRLHANDANRDAFIDADLHRLEFVNRYSVLADKKERYIAALDNIAKKYADNRLSALAAFRAAQAMMVGDSPYERQQEKKKQANYTEVKKRLDQIVAKYPKSEGGSNARYLLNSITEPYVTVQTEKVVLPDLASKILVQYRNTPKLWFRIVPIDFQEYKDHIRRGGSDKLKKRLVNAKYLKEWMETMPATADYDYHSAEVKIDALPLGMYIVLVSADEKFSSDDNLLYYTIFETSMLSVITQTNGLGYVLDRKTGEPVSGATIELYAQKYTRNYYELELAETTTSGRDGSFRIKTAQRNYQAISAVLGKDRMYVEDYLGFYERTEDKLPREHTFFYTDRSIYRPGQTIYFKGIMLRAEENGKKNNVMADQNTEVVFYDANNQKVSSLNLKTNEFGSFTGSFVAPEGLLTGNMRIANNTGSVDISVEEYKRPKFSVSFDTLKASYSLNDKVTVNGKALAYAGNTIDNATVNYRVVRNTRWPYFWSYRWWGMPSSPEMEITRGTAQTKADGSFNIQFTTIPDKSINPESMPVFTYTVYADVTDINGETRSGSQTVNAGYTSVELSVEVPDHAKPTDVDTIKIITQNLNGSFVPASVAVRISKLQQPAQLYRKRYWPAPDQYIIDEATFRNLFPLDEYKDEADHEKWALDTRKFDKTLTTTKDGQVALPVSTWNENGWYVLELETQDKSGKKITEKKYIHIFDRNNKGKAAAALLIVPVEQEAEPGDNASIDIASAYDNATIVQQVQTKDDLKTELRDYNGAALTWNKNIAEKDRGGIVLNYLMVKDSRVYIQIGSVNVPYTNKELDIVWETHRDKLQPGQKETWTMVIRGNKKEKAAAEMVATLYDASLDAFRPHKWYVNGLYPKLYANYSWDDIGFGTMQGIQLAVRSRPGYEGYYKTYDALILIEPGERLYYADAIEVSSTNTRKRSKAQSMGAVDAYKPAAAQKASEMVMANGPAIRSEDEMKSIGKNDADVSASIDNGAGIALRSDFRETAFFYPQLRTDAEGNVRIEFTMPEALTEWKLMTLAHTKDMSYGMMEGKVKTQKDLMVMPGLPRFLRQGDDIVISSKISNLSDKALNGTATLQILDAQTLKPLDLPFRLKNAKTSFTSAKGQSAAVSWNVHVPESLYQPVILRITASAGNFTDGEENVLPVLSNRMMVTETLPLWINGNGDKNFSFDKLRHSDTSRTLSQYKLTLEYTGNPAWYAVQALPYVMEYPYECAEQTFNRYYATALAAHIVKQNPRIEEIFRSWGKLDTAALLSNLEKNQELKSALLEETPWVMEAKNETEQKHRIALLFETHKLSRDLDRNMKKLEDMLLPEGGFPWFKGMYPDRYITQYIVTGLARLKQLGIEDSRGNMQRILDRAIPYLDKKMREDYDELQKNRVKMEDQHIGYIEVQYLYMRTFFGAPEKANIKTAYDYYKGQATKYWPKFNPYMKGMIALALHRTADIKTPQNILASLRETAIRKEEMGMYWMERGRSYWWYDAPIEAQSLLIECFSTIDKGTPDIDAMKVWLLKQKQTQNWHTTKATADACYALLLSGTQWLMNDPVVTIQMGDKTIKSTEIKTEKGTGYFKLNYEGIEIKPQMGDIKLSVQNNTGSTSWGAVYWQYFEQMDKISFAATPLVVKKQLFIVRNTDRGEMLEPITDQQSLKVGDKVKVRIELQSDRDMEYVHMKDMRAACFEPVNVISSYKWQGGLGYYESTKDASVNFFFDHLRRGKYVFEYPLFVTNKGNFSNGITTIQCMYAPEFSSHTEGIRVNVP